MEKSTPTSSIFNYSFKKEKGKKKFFLDFSIFSRLDFSWEGGGTLPQLIFKLSQDLCKKEPYRFSG